MILTQNEYELAITAVRIYRKNTARKIEKAKEKFGDCIDKKFLFDKITRMQMLIDIENKLEWLKNQDK